MQFPVLTGGTWGDLQRKLAPIIRLIKSNPLIGPTLPRMGGRGGENLGIQMT